MTSTVTAQALSTPVHPGRPRLRLVEPPGPVLAPAAPRTIRVLLAGGPALVRAALRALLDSEAGIAVTADAATGEDAVAAAARTRPDVVLVDATFPDLDVVETTRGLAALPGVRVMVLTGTETDESLFAALRAGASGVLIKDTDPAELVRAVRLVAHGDGLLSPSLTRRLIAEFAAQPAQQRIASDGGRPWTRIRHLTDASYDRLGHGCEA
jgi:DNA-binding NarL/FixJ family response regulator